MQVLLCNPISSYASIVTPNLGLGYLAKYLKRDGHSVEVLDCQKEKMTLDDFRKVIEHKNCQLFGIQMFTSNAASVAASLDIVKDVNPEIITIAGGPHISAMPETTLKMISSLDYGLVGESEHSLPLFTRYLEESGNKEINDISGLVYRVGDGDVQEIKRNLIIDTIDVDEVDAPDWEAIDPFSYPGMPHGSITRKSPVAPIVTSRGCPYNCTYCSGKTIHGKSIRFRSIGKIISEIEYLYSKGIREIHFEDDNLTYDKTRAMKLFHELRQFKDLHWACPNGLRLDRLDQELIQSMEASGCYSIAVGIETGSERLMKKIKRGITKKMIRDKIFMVKSYSKINLTGFFIVGYPDETISELQDTIDFALSLPLLRVYFSYLVPLPGTRIYEELNVKGCIDPEAYFLEEKRVESINFVPEYISREILIKMTKRAYYRFYFRLHIVINNLIQIRSLSQLMGAISRFIHVLSR